MISSLRMANFKCFEDITVPLAPLTLLAGVNSIGKNTLLQALLLLRQSWISGSFEQRPRGIVVNGALVRLGQAHEILYDHAKQGERIRFELETNNAQRVRVAINAESNENSLAVSDESDFAQAPLGFSLFNDNFFYLSAERIGPRTSFNFIDPLIGVYNRLGNGGEYCAHFLALAEEKTVKLPIKMMEHEAAESASLFFQVQAWLSEIGQKVQIRVMPIQAVSLVTMEFAFQVEGQTSRWHTPVNVGFGLTYALPIFVAVLATPAEGLVLIENPEAHLHPRGQVVVGKFLARAAAAGVQIILETHSDHILNGIRIAVKQGLISPDQTVFHFFDRLPEEPNTSIVTPHIDRHGRLDRWPEGFFDEWENGLAELL